MTNIRYFFWYYFKNLNLRYTREKGVIFMIIPIQLLVIALIVGGFGLLLMRPKFIWSNSKKELYNKLKSKKWNVIYQNGYSTVAVSEDNSFKISRTCKPNYRFNLISLKEPQITLVTYSAKEGLFNPISVILEPLAKQYKEQTEQEEKILISQRLNEL
jgi:hypothetical protein